MYLHFYIRCSYRVMDTNSKSCEFGVCLDEWSFENACQYSKAKVTTSTLFIRRPQTFAHLFIGHKLCCTCESAPNFKLVSCLCNASIRNLIIFLQVEEANDFRCVFWNVSEP